MEMPSTARLSKQVRVKVVLVDGCWGLMDVLKENACQQKSR